ncbi:cocaine- and amphetamine-regulated transcript protein-like [Siniperca chuatsi]|uniref:cocaine- and amphetamine-regulated transcript protein-like n=1 Tax=Siniperca chuatsi TaxID=119488 RepID=UPI001CE1D420|nr:cocaine- and amphetamine-regulated transcript protein-like [Siniperca chuatsi]
MDQNPVGSISVEDKTQISCLGGDRDQHSGGKGGDLQTLRTSREPPQTYFSPPAEEKDSACLCFSTMVSARALLLAATYCCAYLWLARAEDSSLETRSLDFPLKTQQEKELIDALQEVLEKLRSKEMPLEKKLGWLPSCDAGEPCAVRKGARIGTLCSCPRGTSCNFYVLKCL